MYAFVGGLKATFTTRCAAVLALLAQAQPLLAALTLRFDLQLHPYRTGAACCSPCCWLTQCTGICAHAWVLQILVVCLIFYFRVGPTHLTSCAVSGRKHMLTAPPAVQVYASTGPLGTISKV